MNRLDKLYNNSPKYSIDDNSKLVIMSDCHRGSGDKDDNFVQNQNIFESALLHYYHNGFTYIELGDGDEMWEVNNFHDIINEHLDTFKILKKFHNQKRLIMICGNHDLCKKNKNIMKEYFYKYHDKVLKKDVELLKDLRAYESIVLEYKKQGLFLLHGHQVDALNCRFWKLARFLVKNVWKPLEQIGFKDPTSAAKNYRVTKKVEKSLTKWSDKSHKIVIAGHTHRPVYPKQSQSPYFNDGSCIHPNGITCLEIENGTITLVKWKLKLRSDGIISAGKEIIEGPENILTFVN